MMHEPCSPRCPVCRRRRALHETLIGLAIELQAVGVRIVWETMLEAVAFSPEHRAAIWLSVIDSEGGVTWEAPS